MWAVYLFLHFIMLIITAWGIVLDEKHCETLNLKMKKPICTIKQLSLST